MTRAAERGATGAFCPGPHSAYGLQKDRAPQALSVALVIMMSFVYPQMHSLLNKWMDVRCLTFQSSYHIQLGHVSEALNIILNL